VLAGPSPPPPPLFIFVLFLVGLFAHTLFRIRTPYFNGQAAAVATNYVLIETIQLDNDVEMQAENGGGAFFARFTAPDPGWLLSRTEDIRSFCDPRKFYTVLFMVRRVSQENCN
jgi:hypothetical protein